MKNITVLDLLKKYKGWMNKGEIQFLNNDSHEFRNILGKINSLIDIFNKQSNDDDENISENQFELHQLSGEIWRELISASLKSIDENSKGSLLLYDYVEKATEFEDLLYGLEKYYRDHTLHSLWVYFIGEHIMRDKLKTMHNNLNWYVFNDLESSDRQYLNSKKIVSDLHEEVNKKRDATWCIISLCHDLGYSLSKLDKLNVIVKDVLKFFNVDNYSQVGYNISIEQQYNITQFLELMAMDVRIEPDLNGNEAQIKCYRDDSTYWKLCRALEKKKHGILSAYLMYKVLGIFADSSISGTVSEWGLDVEEATNNIIRGDILFAIAQHEFDFAHLNFLGGFSEILILADELEEFSRHGRQLLTRQYHPTMANSDIEFEIFNNKNEVAITFHYKVAKHRNLSDFFALKAKRLTQIFSLTIDKKYNPLNSFQIVKIVLIARKGTEDLKIEFLKSGKHIAYLPSYNSKEKKLYNLECKDDDILVLTKEKPCNLENWLKGFDG